MICPPQTGLVPKYDQKLSKQGLGWLATSGEDVIAIKNAELGFSSDSEWVGLGKKERDRNGTFQIM